MFYLPGCYNFNDSLKMITLFIKDKANELILLIYKFENMISF